MLTNIRWEQHPAVVNAFYNPNTNDIGELISIIRITFVEIRRFFALN